MLLLFCIVALFRSHLILRADKIIIVMKRFLRPEAIIPHLKHILEYGDKFHNIFYTWDPSSKQIGPKNGKRIKFVRITMVYSLVYVIGQMVAILINRQDASLMDRFQGTLLWVAYAAIFLIRWEWSPNPDTVQLLNLLCQEIEQNAQANGNRD